jgi:hypothetical protein
MTGAVFPARRLLPRLCFLIALVPDVAWGDIGRVGETPLQIGDLVLSIPQELGATYSPREGERPWFDYSNVHVPQTVHALPVDSIYLALNKLWPGYENGRS